MLNSCVLLISLWPGVTVQTSVAQSTHRGPRVFTLQGSQYGHRFAVRFEQDNFRARGRTIVWVRHDTDTGPQYLPGERIGRRYKSFLGWDTVSGDFIKGKSALKELEKRDTELISLRVTVDGRNWPVKPSLYRSIIDPDLPQPENKDQDYATGTMSRDGRTLKVRLLCSDGAGAYYADWTFRRNGKHVLDVSYAG